MENRGYFCISVFAVKVWMAGLEAMASGIPLIAADNRGTREYLIDQENGLVCNAASADEFAKAILSLYENKEQRQRYAARAQNTVKKFSLHESAAKMSQIYQKLPKVPGSYYRK